MAETCTNICAARNRAASDMQVGKSDVARSRTVSALIMHPEIVAQKTHMGDWEDDTVIGKNDTGGMVTLAERKPRYVLAVHIRSKHAAEVTAVSTRLLTPYKDKCHTITFDNGREFAEHEKMAAELKVDIYFLPIPITPGSGD